MHASIERSRGVSVLREVKDRGDDAAGVLNSEEVRKGGQRCAVHGEGMQGGVKGLVSREAKTGRRNRNETSLADDGLGEGLSVNRRGEDSLNVGRMQGGCSNVLALILIRY